MLQECAFVARDLSPQPLAGPGIAAILLQDATAKSVAFFSTGRDVSQCPRRPASPAVTASDESRRSGGGDSHKKTQTTQKDWKMPESEKSVDGGEWCGLFLCLLCFFAAIGNRRVESHRTASRRGKREIACSGGGTRRSRRFATPGRPTASTGLATTPSGLSREARDIYLKK